MINPERVNQPTPAGGDYSELYKLDRRGNLAKRDEDIVEFRILEKKSDGTLLKTTYALK
ncbi:MAG: hypothetical protein J6Q14_01335 [Oscillospiraceae bacterium]|nr:hypothetical protein [Oscillospiraceae bacterium]